jgi:hypothetical protein
LQQQATSSPWSIIEWCDERIFSVQRTSVAPTDSTFLQVPGATAEPVELSRSRRSPELPEAAAAAALVVAVACTGFINFTKAAAAAAASSSNGDT